MQMVIRSPILAKTSVQDLLMRRSQAARAAAANIPLAKWENLGLSTQDTYSFCRILVNSCLQGLLLFDSHFFNVVVLRVLTLVD